jgi:hypothetical protein
VQHEQTKVSSIEKKHCSLDLGLQNLVFPKKRTAAKRAENHRRRRREPKDRKKGPLQQQLPP